MKQIIGILITAMFIVAAMGTITTATEPEHPAPLLAPSNPIWINGSVELAAVASEGDGSSEAPYLIDSLEIEGTVGFGIYLANTTAYYVISNCHIHNVTGGSWSWLDGDPYTPNYGIVVIDAINGNITGNTIRDTTGGIMLYRSNHTMLHDNTVNNYTQYGAWLSNSSCNNTVRDNSFDGYDWVGEVTSSNGGLYVGTYSNDTWIDENYVFRNIAAIIMYGGFGNNIWNNTLYANALGVGVDEESNLSIVSNQFIYGIDGVDVEISMGINTMYNNITHHEGNAIIYTFVADSLIHGNNITEIDLMGMRFEQFQTSTISNNSVSVCATGIHIVADPDPGMVWATFATNNTVTACLINVSDVGACVWWNTSTHGNWWGDYTGSDTDGDGIGETPYTFLANTDYYPLCTPYTTPAPPIGGGAAVAETLPPLSPAPTPDSGGWGISISMGWMMWLGAALILVGFLRVPVPGLKPSILILIGLILVVLNFIW